MKSTTIPWQLKFWQLPQLPDLELLHGLNITHNYPRHMHEDHSIVLMIRGTETTTYRGKSVVAGPETLLLINAEEVHSSQSRETEYRILKIKTEFLNRVSRELFGLTFEPYFPETVLKDPPLFRLMLELHIKLEENNSFLEQESELVFAVGRLLARQNRVEAVPALPGREPRYVRLVRDYISAHYAENTSLAELSSLTNLSPFHLLRVFRTHVGCPPHEYQTQVRIAQARKLMRTGNPICDVAFATGFVDQSHFTRNFKRIVGVSPRQYFPQRKIVQDKPSRIR